jgi:hypothetical protein
MRQRRLQHGHESQQQRLQHSFDDVAPMLRRVIGTKQEPLKTKENKSQQDAT